MLKLTVLGVGHDWNADVGYLLFEMQTDVELNKVLSEITKPGIKLDESPTDLTPSKTIKIANHLFNLIMERYGGKLRTFYKDKTILGIYRYDTRWYPFSDIKNVIETIDPEYRHLLSIRVIDEVIAKIERNTLTPLPQNLSLVQYKNLVIDTECFAKTGRLLQCAQNPNPDIYALYYIDRQIALEPEIISKLEGKVLYDTSDIVELAEKYTPSLVKLFKEWTGANWINLYEILGYTLMVHANPLKLIFILLGKPNSGKTTYINLLRQIIGEHNVVNLSITQLNSEGFERAHLFLKMLNVYDDLPNKRMEVSDLKVLTGEGYITAKVKYREPLTFRVATKMLFAVNELPSHWEGADEAFWDRIRIIQFPNQFEKRTIEYPENEFSHALTLGLYFAKAMLNKGDITSDRESKLIVEKAKRQNSSVEYFVAEITAEDKNAETEFKVLYTTYEKWCKQWGITPLAQNIFSRILNQMGYSIVVTRVEGEKAVRVVKGLKLRSV